MDSPGKSNAHVLVVDDDREIGALLVRYLVAQGLHASVAHDGEQLRHAMRREAVDLLLLDLGLPGEDGLSLMRELRTRWQGPVIIVSGRGESVERIIGLELGADDYITKPFDFRELLARIRSVLRRSRGEAVTAGGAYVFAGMRLDPAARSLQDADGYELALTAGEFDLLLALVEHARQVMSRDALMTAIHGRAAGPYERAIDVQVARLRRKLEADPADPRLIRSVRGAGYLLACPVERH